MAIGIQSDFKIYDELFNSVYVERLGQMSDAFNAASNGAITLTSESKLGNFEKQAFIAAMEGIVKHRDPTSVLELTPDSMSQLEVVNVKINRGSLIENTLDMFKKIGQTGDAFTVAAADALAMATMQDQLNTVLAAGMGAIQSEAGMVSGDGTTAITYTDIATLMSKYGDQLGSIKLLVMHSSTYYSLMNTAISEKLWNVAGTSINDGSNPTMGIPTLVTDSGSLDMTTGKAVMALTEGALNVVDSETAAAELQRKLGLANIVLQYQTETAYNLGVKGYAYDVTVGISPTNASLLLTTTWDKVATDLKHTAGAIQNCSV